MKRFLFAIALTLGLPLAAHAQCTGVFPPNTLCGNLSGTARPPAPFTASGTVVGPGSSTDNAVARFNGTAGTSIQNSGVLIDDSNNISPATSDTGALGTSSLMWSDLFLASGSVVNWNAGDVTLTHSANTLTFAGATSGYVFNNGGISAGGNSSVTGTFGVSGDFAVATNKFTVAATSGNTLVAGTLSVTGAATLSSTLNGKAIQYPLSITIQTITATGTYTPTAGTLYAIVECVGGGGGGGGADGAPDAGSGGGGGEYAKGIFTAAQLGASQSVTIGAAGTAGVGATDGGNGGNTSFGALLTANGGGGGDDTERFGGAGGTGGTGGQLRIAGQGGTGMMLNTYSNGGVGGSSQLGRGGTPGIADGDTINGSAGAGYGAGGGGGAAEAATDADGGAGRPGVCIVTDYVY